MRFRLIVVLAFLATALAPAGATLADNGTGNCSPTPLQFTPALTLTPSGNGGYEPSIEVDSAGTVFVTAHKLSLSNEGDRLASWLWYSKDGGQTFQEMKDGVGVKNKEFAFEGDLALDAKDRLYFVDTWLADNWFSRWSNHGDTWDFTRPAVPTPEADDRPWLVARGDGTVFYMSNTAYGPQDRRLTIHRSTDGGTTFTQTVGFQDSGWGTPSVDPNSQYVYAFMNDKFKDPQGLISTIPPSVLKIQISSDNGDTWHTVKVADYIESDHGQNGYPTTAVAPNGDVYVLWFDGDSKTKLYLGRSTDHGEHFTIYDITPFAGTHIYSWITIGSGGTVGIAWYGSTALKPNDFYPYAMVFNPQSHCVDPITAQTVCDGPTMTYAKVDSVKSGANGDFFQNAFGPADTMHVSWTKLVGGSRVILYAKQVAGPNLAGGDWCGQPVPIVPPPTAT